MIVSGFLYLSATLLNAVLGLFPNSTGTPAGFTNAVDTLAGYVGILDPLVPLDTLATVFTLIISYELAVFTFRGFRWIISHIPFIGGRS